MLKFILSKHARHISSDALEYTNTKHETKAKHFDSLYSAI